MQPEVFKENNSGLEYLKIKNQSDTVVVMFHGYGASMMDLYGIGEAILPKDRPDWIFPNGHLGLDMMGMGAMARAWFPIDMAALEQAMQSGSHRDFSDMYSPEFAEALELSQKFFNALKTKYKNIILGGFSQGAMIATHLSLKNSGGTKALICFSGAFAGKKQLLELSENSTKFPFFQSHGKQDPVLGFDGAMKLFELLKLSSHEGEFIGFDGAHEIPMQVIKKAEAFINRI